MAGWHVCYTAQENSVGEVTTSMKKHTQAVKIGLGKVFLKARSILYLLQTIKRVLHKHHVHVCICCCDHKKTVNEKKKGGGGGGEGIKKKKRGENTQTTHIQVQY